MKMSEDAYLVYFKRTAFSRSRPNDPERDVFNSIRMDEALGQLIKDSVSTTGVKAEEINDVITGCAIQADENWTYGGRQPVLLAGMPVSVPAMSLDRACSSSLNAITIGAMEIMTGVSDIVLAGGMEHMTHVPLSNNPHIKPNISSRVGKRRKTSRRTKAEEKQRKEMQKKQTLSRKRQKNRPSSSKREKNDI